MIRKSEYRLFLGTNAKRLPKDHAQTKRSDHDLGIAAEAVNIALQRCTLTNFGPLQSDPLNGVYGAAGPKESR
jgi:hypothetical protein